MPTRLDTIKEKIGAVEDVEKWEHCWWEHKLVQWGNAVWQVLRKLKIELLHDSAIPFLGT